MVSGDIPVTCRLDTAAEVRSEAGGVLQRFAASSKEQ
jgi:hypothetical protein